MVRSRRDLNPGSPVVGCFIVVVVPWVRLGGLLVLMSVLLLVVFLSLFSVRVVVIAIITCVVGVVFVPAFVVPYKSNR